MLGKQSGNKATSMDSKHQFDSILKEKKSFFLLRN